MSEHPPLFRLDAHAAGDADARVEEHLTRCATCAGYIERLRVAVRAHSEREGANAADFVLGLDELQRAQPRGSSARELPRRRFFPRSVAFAGVSVLAAAAALVLVTRSSPTDVTDVTELAVREPSTRFKGNLQLAVIRDRRGEQTRTAAEVRVRPGDRLRAEIGVDDARPIEVGFLGKDGTWVLLLAPTLLEAGAYFSERAAEFDETPTEGWIIAGRPEAVTRARLERSFGDVSAIAVVADP